MPDAEHGGGNDPATAPISCTPRPSHGILFENSDFTSGTAMLKIVAAAAGAPFARFVCFFTQCPVDAVVTLRGLACRGGGLHIFNCGRTAELPNCTSCSSLRSLPAFHFCPGPAATGRNHDAGLDQAITRAEMINGDDILTTLVPNAGAMVSTRAGRQ